MSANLERREGIRTLNPTHKLENPFIGAMRVVLASSQRHGVDMTSFPWVGYFATFRLNDEFHYCLNFQRWITLSSCCREEVMEDLAKGSFALAS
jgi:hypothetical protein